MKRSEMIKLMVNAYNMQDINKSPEIRIAGLLALCELHGMLPPIEPGRTESDLDLGVPEWEPEDEIERSQAW